LYYFSPIIIYVFGESRRIGPNIAITDFINT
jgi:hypothetical protein